MSKHSPILTFMLALCSIGLVVALVANPETSFEAAVRGLKIWWEVVFPALLPFIVVSEIMMGVGVVHFVGVLLEPLMRPLFNVPGTGGFVLTMGFASGYPVAAKLTTRLREQGGLTREEGERLVSFTTTGDPLFVIGAVAVGFFHSEQLGFIMAATHYLSAVVVGVIYRFYAPYAPTTNPIGKNKLPLPVRALQAMHRARVRDGRPFGRLMGEAVQSALNTLLMVGGFLIVFSVLIQLFSTIHLTYFLSTALNIFLGPFGFHPDFSKAVISGLFEVTLGAQAASDVPASVSLLWKAAVATAIISWGGLSVHAQIASILSQTDIRFAPFLFARVLHAGVAVILTLLLWKPLTAISLAFVKTIPVFMISEQGAPIHSWWEILVKSSYWALSILTMLVLLSVLIYKLFRRSSRFG